MKQRSKNTNCLAGLRCPKCLQEDKILLQALCWVAVTDDGTDPYDDELKMGEVNWDDDSPAICPECNFAGSLLSFRIEKE